MCSTQISLSEQNENSLPAVWEVVVKSWCTLTDNFIIFYLIYFNVCFHNTEATFLRAWTNMLEWGERAQSLSWLQFERVAGTMRLEKVCS